MGPMRTDTKVLVPASLLELVVLGFYYSFDTQLKTALEYKSLNQTTCNICMRTLE